MYSKVILSKTTEKMYQTGEDDISEAMFRLIQDVCKFLAEQYVIHSTSLVQFIELLTSGTFPVTNIR